MYETENLDSTYDLKRWWGFALYMCLPSKEDVCCWWKTRCEQPREKFLFKGKHEATHGRLYDCSMSKRINLHHMYMFQSDSLCTLLCYNKRESRSLLAVRWLRTIWYALVPNIKRDLRGSQTELLLNCKSFGHCFYSLSLWKMLVNVWAA